VAVVVLVVFIADVERRIGEDQVNRTGLDPPQQFDAVALMYRIQGQPGGPARADERAAVAHEDLDAHERVLDTVRAGRKAERRAAQYIREYCDPGYTAEPPFADWEVELHPVSETFNT
jgi:hypothetical protein